MKIEISEWVALKEGDICSAEHLSEVSGLSAEDIDALVEVGIIAPVEVTPQPQTFHLRCLVTVNTARRLRDDFELDRNGMILALTLMQRNQELEQELTRLRALLG